MAAIDSSPGMDPWGDTTGERRLWVTIGNSAQPVVLAVAALLPDVVIPIVTSGSVGQIERAKDMLDYIEPGLRGNGSPLARWDDPVVITPDDLTENWKVLDAAVRRQGSESGPRLDHLLINGGTVAMSAAAQKAISSLGHPRIWNLADRKGVLNSLDGVVVPIPPIGVPLEAHLVATGSDFTIKKCRRQRQVHGGELDRSDGSRDPGFPFEGEFALSELGSMLSSIVSGTDVRKWSKKAKEWLGARGVGSDLPDDQLVGEILEWAVYAFICRGLSARLKGSAIDAWAYLGTSFTRVNQMGIEADIIVVHGPRLTLLSVGCDNTRIKLSLKATEARDRVQHLGGGEARSLTIVMRTGKERAKTRKVAAKQARAHREEVGFGVGQGIDRHQLLYVQELFGIDPEKARPTATAALEDPLTVNRFDGESEKDMKSRQAARDCFFDDLLYSFSAR